MAHGRFEIVLNSVFLFLLNFSVLYLSVDFPLIHIAFFIILWF